VHTIDVLGTRERAKLRAGRDLACNVQTRCRLAEKKLYVEFGEYVGGRS
jgi:hypothetical protein